MGAIVDDDDFGDAKVRDDVLPYETFYLPLGDGRQRLGFQPFGEVVHLDNEKFFVMKPGGRGRGGPFPIV